MDVNFIDIETLYKKYQSYVFLKSLFHKHLKDSCTNLV